MVQVRRCVCVCRYVCGAGGVTQVQIVSQIQQIVTNDGFHT